MTTIAWDGAMLAADRQVNADGTRAGEMVKVRRGRDGRLFGCAGRASEVHPALTALAAGRKPKMSDETEAIEVRPDGSVWLHDTRGSTPMLPGQFAIGSGACFALAAMACGRSATEAVLLAARFDHCTGNVLDTLTWEAPPPKRKPPAAKRAPAPPTEPKATPPR